MITGVVLAAGLSRRMGRSKLLLELGGRPVIRHSVERVLAAGMDPVLVVVGPSHARLAGSLHGLPVRLVVNVKPEDGQGTSIRTGIAALPPGTSAVLIALGDQPAVPAEVIPGLVRALEAPGKVIAAPAYRDGRGNPVLFRAQVFPELLALSGDQGARFVVERDPTRVALVGFDLPRPEDIDTPDDYERLRSRGNPGVN